MLALSSFHLLEEKMNLSNYVNCSEYVNTAVVTLTQCTHMGSPIKLNSKRNKVEFMQSFVLSSLDSKNKIQMQTTHVRVSLLKNDIDIDLTLMCYLDLINDL